MIEEKNKKTVFDAVIDTDAYNEIDDQFAISYMFCSQDKINVKAIYAAPFKNSRASSAKEGMEKSYLEILKLLELMGNDDFNNVYKGSDSFLSDGSPIISGASKDLAARAINYSKENPLYVIAIAALTNVASAILINPQIAERIVLVWLGGNAVHIKKQNEFNLCGDIDAANICFGTVKRIVQLPCNGVVSGFITTKPELEFWLNGKNALCDYLVKSVVDFHSDLAGTPWSKCIWDVTAVAYLLNEDNRFMQTRTERIPFYTHDRKAEYKDNSGELTYVSYIYRDKLFAELFSKLENDKLFRFIERN